LFTRQPLRSLPLKGTVYTVHFGWFNRVDQPGGTRVNAPLHGSLWLIQPCWSTRGDPCKRAFTRFTLVDSTVLINLGDSCKRAFNMGKLLPFVTRPAICLTTGPQPLPKLILHKVRSSASFFNSQYPLVSLMPSSSCLPLLPRIPFTLFLPSIFPSIMCFRTQFLR